SFYGCYAALPPLSWPVIEVPTDVYGSGWALFSAPLGSLWRLPPGGRVQSAPAGLAKRPSFARAAVTLLERQCHRPATLSLNANPRTNPRSDAQNAGRRSWLLPKSAATAAVRFSFVDAEA